MSSIEELQGAFSVAIFSMVNSINKLQLTPKQHRRILEAISDDIRKYSDSLIPEISIGAKCESDRLGIDLETQGWHEQPKFDPGRRLFFLEHMVPVSTIRKECLKACSVKEIKTILRSKVRIVWILREENDTLNALGYRYKRTDPIEAYSRAGIHICGK